MVTFKNIKIYLLLLNGLLAKLLILFSTHIIKCSIHNYKFLRRPEVTSGYEYHNHTIIKTKFQYRIAQKLQLPVSTVETSRSHRSLFFISVRSRAMCTWGTCVTCVCVHIVTRRRTYDSAVCCEVFANIFIVITWIATLIFIKIQLFQVY